MDEITEFDVLVYHDNCVDGLAAVAIATQGYGQYEMYPATHGEPINMDMFVDKKVCYLDFSPKKDEALEILKVAKCLYVIDHHVTAEQELKDIVHPNFFFIYNVTLSGAQLAWGYFIQTKQPVFIKLIGDRDLWTKKYKDSDALSLALKVKGWGYKEMFNHIKYLVENEIRYLDTTTSELITAGDQYGVYHKHMVDQICGFAYAYRLDDYADTEVLRVNCPMGLMSDVGAVLAKKSPSGVAWLTYSTEEYTKHSLRVSAESNYNAAAFAASLGGGGHEKAAGWQVSHYRAVDRKELFAELKDKPVIDGSTSDGYHTFDELYYHRMVLFSIVCTQNKQEAWKSLLHSDGTMFDDYFIAGIKTPEGEYTYHYHMDTWDAFAIKEIERAPEWDGHTPSDITRLYSLINQPKKEVPVNPLN